jgi:hypothetical protein
MSAPSKPGSPWRSSVIPNSHSTQLDKDRKNELQWKYVGYPGLATWMASSPDLFILRRFDYLNARVLLTLQDQIAEKEDLLHKIDMQQVDAPLRPRAENVTMRLEGNKGSVRKDPNIERPKLLKEIRELLKEYSRSLRCCPKSSD